MKQNCPVCGKPVAADHKPFCSRGCKDRDLLQWLGEGYRIAGPQLEEEPESGMASGLDTPGQAD